MAKVQHPVYPAAASPDLSAVPPACAGRIEQLKQAVTPLMEMSEAEMAALVPDRTWTSWER